MGTGASFAAALRVGDAAAVRSFPKTDLHAHGYLSARIESLERRLGRALLRPPCRMDGLGEFQEFLRLALDPHVGTVEGAELAAAVAIADAVDDGVSVFEMSFDIWPAPLYSDGLHGYLRFLESLVEQCQDRLRLRPELGISRRYASNTALMDHAAEAVASAVFASIDLYSTEDACAPEDVQPLYAQARGQGLMLKAHVGGVRQR